jgi:hypothetical protein
MPLPNPSPKREGLMQKPHLLFFFEGNNVNIKYTSFKVSLPWERDLGRGHDRTMKLALLY